MFCFKVQFSVKGVSFTGANVLSFLMTVPGAGLEPARPKAGDF